MSHISLANLLAINAPGIQPPLCPYLREMDQQEETIIITQDINKIPDPKASWAIIKRGTCGVWLVSCYASYNLTERANRDNSLFSPIMDEYLRNICAITGTIAMAIDFLVTCFFCRDRDLEELIRITDAGDKCLDAARYGRLREKVTQIKIQLTEDLINQTEKNQLILAKSYFKTTIKMKEHRIF